METVRREPENVKVHDEHRVRRVVAAYGYETHDRYSHHTAMPVITFRNPGAYRVFSHEPCDEVKQACDLLKEYMVAHRNIILYLPDTFYDSLSLVNLSLNLPAYSIIYAPRLLSFPAEIEMLWGYGAGIIMPRLTRLGGQVFKLPTKREFLERVGKIARQVFQEGKCLDMRRWHSCATTHCIGGWAITNMYKTVGEIERLYGSVTAAYVALGPRAYSRFRLSTFEGQKWLYQFFFKEKGNEVTEEHDVK